jgi:hypothetical protein
MEELSASALFLKTIVGFSRLAATAPKLFARSCAPRMSLTYVNAPTLIYRALNNCAASLAPRNKGHIYIIWEFDGC